MSQRLVLAFVILTSVSIATAQTNDVPYTEHFAHPESWLEQNYRHAEPPAPRAPVPEEEMLAQLADIQNTTLAVLRKADFSGDYEAALAAAWQALNNAQVIGALRSRAGAASPVYLIALKDQTVRVAQAWWVEDNALHYVTGQGKLEQVPLDQVDRDLSIRLNRERHLEFQLPPAK